MTLLSIVAYYLFASYNKRLQYNRKQTKSMRFDKVVHFLSAYRTLLRNFAEHLSIFLLNTPQYFCRTLFSILTDNGLVLLQNIFPCFCRFISSMAENLLACFQNTVFLQNISQQFYRTPPNIFLNCLQQFCRAHICNFAENLQKIFSPFQSNIS